MIELKIFNNLAINNNIQQSAHPQNLRMQQHYQVINLHNIIRNHEAKIQQLRQQLRIANEREHKRYGQFVENNKITVQEKDKMIEYLKIELERAQKSNISEVVDFSQKLDKEKDKFEKQILLLKRKCLQLQAKVKRQQNQFQTQSQSLISQNQSLSLQLQKQMQSRTFLTAEISKLNHFYKNSLFEVGKRKQTLLWVDKFTEYIETIEAKQKRTLDDVSSFVKNEVNGLKNVLAEMVKQVGKSEEDVGKAKEEVGEHIFRQIDKIKAQFSSVLAENEQFWNHLLKQHKQSSQEEALRGLQQQLERQSKKHSAQIEQLKTTIKGYESEKKTIILGFQELRSLTESREANYRQEIKHLKKTIEQLLEIGTERDREFENQIKILTSQIENISERYYENIQMPVRRANIKISEEVEQVKLEVSRIQGNSSLKGTVEGLEKIVQKYVLKNSRQGSSELSSLLQQENQTISEIMQAMNGKQQSSKVYNERGNTFDHEYDEITEEEQVIFKEKYNKSQYQIVLAKKHLQKLKQYCSSLQKKSLPSWHKKEKQANTLQRMMQLQAENQALKQNIDMMRSQALKQSVNLRKKYELKSMSQQVSISCQQNVKSAINKINELHRQIEQHMSMEKHNILQIKESIKLIRTILFKPMESLESLAKEVSEIGLAGVQALVKKPYGNILAQESDHPGANTQRSYHTMFSANDDVKNYRQILAKRTENYQNTNKLMSDLIKILRENSGKQNKAQEKATVKKQQEHTHSHKKQSQLKLIQKRIRDLQGQRLKEKQDHIDKIQKLGESLQKLSKKISKSANLKSSLTKFEVNLDTKISEIVSRTQIKLDKSDAMALKDDVIADLRSKLNQANHESQGLRKEMAILSADKKT